MSLAALRAGGKPALAKALTLIERAPRAPETLALLDEAWADPQGFVLGLTGPPGVGKSTLTDALIRHWRGRGLSVGVIAVDPSSMQSGGALLGDRARLSVSPEDSGVFVRSLASRGRLGGLAALAWPSAILMRAVHDRVILETVGVGQSEIDVAALADVTAVCLQPASGDALQFMKAGLMETPDVLAVAKADLGAPARRAAADLRAAMSLAPPRPDGWKTPTLLLSAQTGEGLAEFVAQTEGRFAFLEKSDSLQEKRADQAASWMRDSLRDSYGRAGLGLLRRTMPAGLWSSGPAPFVAEAAAKARLERIFARLETEIPDGFA
ncbi:methylmalonyl Co-A mutase-associated GTPase MeaB [Neomegalonema sp.]|uniref:ArgK/MeaB family GTPase n=1 Tax=Neomegalonema sp. TaxID=2039713 RepID=UPI00260DB456|nr:methylmalonyl Co-A mutase-associated GTPase MeaB [Neomegalonema sp.]MDD2867245.1 methylmalonyl Co-A mutase-associated GTPase MeaB [Neomegalonema sp.]